MDFGPVAPEAGAGLLKGPVHWPIERASVVESKCRFMRAYIDGMRAAAGADQPRLDTVIAALDQLRSRALAGDAVAVARLNGLLAEVIASYPKDKPEAQYNLGLLYADTGNTAEAGKWLTKASKQGLEQAETELRRLRANR